MSGSGTNIPTESGGGMDTFDTPTSSKDTYVTAKTDLDPAPSISTDADMSVFLVRCPRCSEVVQPKMSRIPKSLAHIFVFILAILGAAGLMFLPYMFGCCSKPVQRCTNCGSILYRNEADFVQPK